MWLRKLLLVEKSLTKLTPHSKLVPVQIRSPVSRTLKFIEMLTFLHCLMDWVLPYRSQYNSAPVPHQGPATVSPQEGAHLCTYTTYILPGLFITIFPTAELLCTDFLLSMRGWGGGINYTARWSRARQPLWCTVSSTHSLPSSCCFTATRITCWSWHFPKLGPSGNDRIS